MPIYEYQCRSCESWFEELIRSPSAAEAVKCPQCGSGTVERRVSVFAPRGGATGGSAGATFAPGGPCGQCADRERCGL